MKLEHPAALCFELTSLFYFKHIQVIYCPVAVIVK